MTRTRRRRSAARGDACARLPRLTPGVMCLTLAEPCGPGSAGSPTTNSRSPAGKGRESHLDWFQHVATAPSQPKEKGDIAMAVPEFGDGLRLVPAPRGGFPEAVPEPRNGPRLAPPAPPSGPIPGRPQSQGWNQICRETLGLHSSTALGDGPGHPGEWCTHQSRARGRRANSKQGGTPNGPTYTHCNQTRGNSTAETHPRRTRYPG